MLDRLELTDKRIQAMADAVRKVIALRDPVGRVIDGWVLPNGLKLDKVRVPLGVICMIYESRPNVTADAAVPLPQERQRRHPARRQGGHQLEHGHPPPIARACEGTALTRRPCSSSARTDRAVVADLLRQDAVHRPGDPARRQEPDPRRGRGLAPYPSSSTTRASATPSWTRAPTWTWPWPSAATPSASGPPPATRWRRCWCTRAIAKEFLAAHDARPQGGGRGGARLPLLPAPDAGRQAGHAGGLVHRVPGPDPVRARGAQTWTRRSSTSPATARATATPS